MARLATFFSLVLLITSVPGGLAGPACSRKYFKATDCVQRCKSKWGWSGTMMGTDRWGPVMHKSNESWEAALSKACGAEPSIVPTAPVGNAQNEPNSSSTLSVVASTPAVTNTFVPSVLSASSSTVESSTSTSISKPSFTSISVSRSTLSSSEARPVFTRVSSTQRQQPTSVPPAPPSTTLAFRPEPVTTKAPQPTPPSTENSGTSSGSTSNSDIQAYLAGHNSIRSRHGAADLTWNDNLAAKAQQWANGCQFKHSGGTLGAFGENLAAGTGSSYNIQTAIKSWTDEVSNYNPSNPQASHFTQVVWKATTQVGCAVQSCDGIFDASFGKAKYYVCEYSPAGNVNGRFAENVQV